MKKLLIVAALTATSAMAQVTVSGSIGASYQLSPVLNYVASPAGASTTRAQGLQTQDGEIIITAVEDLGVGYKVIAKGGVTTRGRDTGVETRDATVTLITPVGAFTGGAVRTCGPWETVMTRVVTGPVRSENETVSTPLPKCNSVDALNYTLPLAKTMVNVTYSEYGAGALNSTGLTALTVSGVYTDGSVMFGTDVTSFAQSTGGTAAVGRPILDGLARTRVFGSYDFGVAKLGLGYQGYSRVAAATKMASVSVPVGHVALGLEYVVRDEQGVVNGELTAAGAGVRAVATALFGATNGDKAMSSTGIGATYSFSKSTSLNASYIVYKDVGANSISNAPKKLEDEYRVRLLKTF